MEWTAVAIVQYPTRAAYDRAAASDAYRAALSRFDETYSQGLVRPASLNLLIHQVLLGVRARQILTGQPSFFPLARMEGVDDDPRTQQGVGRLLAERKLGAEAVVIVNVSRTGTAEQQASDEGYTSKMIAVMAEGGYGPMHLGSAVRVERDYDFDRMVIVYYPGVEFFADLMRSEFFLGIIGTKSLGDHQGVITVPILERL